MKKITNILIILGVLAAAFVATSCGAMDHTYDKWYKYEHTGTISLPVANADENDSTKDGMLKNAELYVRYNATNGLTLRAITKTAQTVSFAGGAYEIQGVEMTAGGEKTYDPSEFGPVKWSALIRLGSFVPEEPPAITIDISTALKGQFNLKRIILEVLIGMLGA
jgi:hypothetical protein